MHSQSGLVPTASKVADSNNRRAMRQERMEGLRGDPLGMTGVAMA
jgi:hypothetical protein